MACIILKNNQPGVYRQPNSLPFRPLVVIVILRRQGFSNRLGTFLLHHISGVLENMLQQRIDAVAQVLLYLLAIYEKELQMSGPRHFFCKIQRVF